MRVPTSHAGRGLAINPHMASGMPTRQPASFNATFSRTAGSRAAYLQLGGATREKALFIMSAPAAPGEPPARPGWPGAPPAPGLSGLRQDPGNVGYSAASLPVVNCDAPARPRACASRLLARDDVCP